MVAPPPALRFTKPQVIVEGPLLSPSIRSASGASLVKRTVTRKGKAGSGLNSSQAAKDPADVFVHECCVCMDPFIVSTHTVS